MEVDDEDPQWVVVDRLLLIAHVGGPVAVLLAAGIVVSLLWWFY